MTKKNADNLGHPALRVLVMSPGNGCSNMMKLWHITRHLGLTRKYRQISDIEMVETKS